MDTASRRRVLAGTLARGLAAGGFVTGRLTRTDAAHASRHRPDPRSRAAHDPVVRRHRRCRGACRGARAHGRRRRRRREVGARRRGSVRPAESVAAASRCRAAAAGLPARATGSGFIVRGDGIILTNNHVVEDAKEITVALSDGTELPAKVLGRDPKTDLAVLKVESPTPLPIVPPGRLRRARASATGWSPSATRSASTTPSRAGIVERQGPRASASGPYDNFIQTDASINPGNSGGPLFDERGEVVGINTAIFSQSGGNIGIGFAIPVNVAKALVPQLEKDGHVTRGWLGVVDPEAHARAGASRWVSARRTASWWPT